MTESDRTDVRDERPRHALRACLTIVGVAIAMATSSLTNTVVQDGRQLPGNGAVSSEPPDSVGLPCDGTIVGHASPPGSD